MYCNTCVQSLRSAIYIIIYTDSCTAQGDIRLYNSNGNPREGHVEVCLNGMWGGVCMKNWDTVDAEVVCFLLGFLASGMLGKNLVQLL